MPIERPPRYIVLALFWTSSLAQAYTIEIGAKRDDVVATYGYPESQLKSSGREILNYKEGSVVLDDDRVVELKFTRGEPKLVRKPAVSTPKLRTGAPRPVPSAGNLKPATPDPTSAARKSPPAASDPTVATKNGLSQVGWIAGVLLMAALLGKARRKIRRTKNPASQSPRAPAPVATPAPLPAVAEPPIAFLSREALDRLEWRRFEELIHDYFESQGWVPQRSRVGADGGIDIFLYRPGEPRPKACVQCKAWRTYTVGVKPVRELFGVMSAENIPEGYFVTTSGYTSEALEFARGKNFHLVTGDDLLARFDALRPEEHERIVRHAFRDDFETPTCPSCDEKMVKRHGESAFWGCRKYPRCHRTFSIRLPP